MVGIQTNGNGPSWATAYAERGDLQPFGSAGLALYAMALKFGYDDLATIGADAVVDGPDDRGCDVVFVDREQGIAIIAQSYVALAVKNAASASKAATLRQAVSFLVEVPIQNVPDRLTASASLLREALQSGDIRTVHVWFVHNCPGSDNVKGELSAVGDTVNAIIRTKTGTKDIAVSVAEISSEILETLYTDTSTPILVNDPIYLKVPSGFRFEEGEWSCLVAPIPLKMLKDLYDKHSTNLFSANVRDFLGMKSGESNINFQMRRSLTEKPHNFFVYNNGLTVLTHKIDAEEADDGINVSLKGFSIVNGAQTTGTIGTSKDSSPDGFVLARFIATNNEDLVADVVRYNNSQNAVTASDFRSTDPIQRRLVQEMREIPDAEYDGGRRGGVSAAIKRRPKLLPSYSVGQALAAAHGDPTVAYNEKSALWSKDALYSRYFCEELNAEHIVFCYALLRAIESEKSQLRTREANGGSKLSGAEAAKLEFYRRRGSVFLLAAAIGHCLETIADQVVPSRFLLSFGKKISPEQAVQLWMPVVVAMSSLHAQLASAFSDGLKNAEKVKEILSQYSQFVAGLKDLYGPIFQPIRESVTFKAVPAKPTP